ncbi:MAG TPA: D-amino-acid transaminase [Chloroflexota bacterium]|nr:D-amino-acid transaminase [Chloroflexota bacterium]
MLAYLNGQVLPLAEAKVSVLDRGFMLADGIYEVMRVYGGKPFALDRHMARLQRSAAQLELTLQPPAEELGRLCLELVRANGLQEGTIYLQVTRGTAPRAHAIPADLLPTTLILTSDRPVESAELRARGVTAITVPDDRWARCDIKTIGLTANVLAKSKAARAGAFEAIFVRDGAITDAASSNVFAVIDGALLTAPKSNYLLAGITRDILVELAQANGLPIREEVFRLEALRRAAEVMVTSTTAEVMPIIELDGAPVGAGTPGPLARKLQELFEDYRCRA